MSIQLSESILEPKMDIKSKVALSLLLASFLYNLYTITSLYF